MRRSAGLACLLVVSMSGVAAAQMPPPPADSPIPNDPAPPPPPPPEPPPPATTETATSSSTTSTAAPATATSSSEGTLGSAVGVGVHAMLSGPVGPAVVYNGGRFHIEGILAFTDLDDGNQMAIAGRGWFHVHDSPGANLSLGGGIGFMNSEMSTGVPGTPAVDASVTVIELGAQVRFFVTRNVALSASLGISILSGDADVISIGGQLTGGLGLTYFIF